MDRSEWMRRAQRGDDEAFYELINSDRERLYRIAYRYLRNEDDVLEAIQEMTYRAYKQLRKLKRPEYVSTWLIRILINYCIYEQKRRRRVLPILEPLPDERASAMDLSGLGIELAVERLELKYRQIILLKYYHDLTIGEIARILERPEGTVKTWLNKALRSLRGTMGTEVDGEPCWNGKSE
ncbi:RNA polymerase sigma factor SigV [Paenibacillus sp. CECT 9249]|uniref:sigma-70 family RNA polymerase sigma factor n=1 Tax=Paenibacillus sp. CECT 9249 TaxID=2845385 RepID=UPI001E421CB4|nr:sigma-70 family RNA polymerase sigma factor [Paenibacillus sp. CECT 9249]CAH0117625.1 RNA polymerase sigma factor SigV [Paenibacillus sp. CECT 9249]